MNQKKKILFLTTGFAVGGAETFLINLLNKLDTQKIDPIVVSLSEKADLEYKLKDTIKVIRILRRWKYDLSPSNHILEILLEKNIKTVFAISLYSFFFLSRALSKSNISAKVIISLHSTKPRSIKDYILNFIYSRKLKGKELLITVCKNQAYYLSKIYHIPYYQFKTIYNGVDTEYFTLPSGNFNIESFRNSLGIMKTDFIILQVATFRKEKKHEDSVIALDILHKKYNLKACLIFVGGGKDENVKKIKKLVSKLKLQDFVKFCGVQNDIKPYYWISDLFTLSSTKETFSIAALEAMACGIPCVLTNIGGASEMIKEGINGYLANPNDPGDLADQWYRVYKEKNRFEKLNIRKIVKENFSLNEMIENYEKQLLS